MKLNRKIVIYVLVLILILIGIILGAIIMQDDDDKENESKGGNGNPTAGTSPMVTVIVVDDFSESLGQIALKIDDPDGLFEDKAKQVRELVETYKGNQQYAQEPPDEMVEEIKTIFAELEEKFGETATSQFMTYLDERGITLDLASDDSQCTINTEGTGVFVAGGAGVFVAGGAGVFVAGGAGTFEDVAHGTRVMALLQDLHKKYTAEAADLNQPLNIEFRRVNIANFDLSNLVNLLSAEIAATRADYPDGQIIVNMSFGIIPCRAIPSLAIYERLMLGFEQTGDDLDALRALFQTWVAIDAPQRNDQAQQGLSYDRFICELPDVGESPLCDGDLRERLRNGADTSIIFVAAAGNGPLDQSGGQAFPYYPAAWGEVIAISGTEEDVDFLTGQSIAPWSNFGTVLMPGRWHWVNPTLSIDREELGTSFAAPRYSYLMALHYAQSKIDVGCSAGIPGPVTPHDWLTNPPATPNQPPC